MKLVFRLIVNAAAILGIAYYVPGIEVSGVYAAILAAVIFGIINAIIGTLLKVLTLPIGILTLGISSLIINAGLFWLTGAIVKGFDVSGFTSALIGASIMWVVSTLSGWLLKD